MRKKGGSLASKKIRSLLIISNLVLAVFAFAFVINEASVVSGQDSDLQAAIDATPQGRSLGQSQQINLDRFLKPQGFGNEYGLDGARPPAKPLLAKQTGTTVLTTGGIGASGTNQIALGETLTSDQGISFNN